MLRIAICDDLKSERDMVKGFLRSFFAAVPYEYTLAEYSRGETMVDDYDDGSVDFDLIFMDIFMDGMLGMEAARCLRRYAPHVSIVFLTTTPAYALESYDVYAYGYLVKPLDGEKTAALLRRFLQEEYEGNQKTLLLKKGCRGRRIAYREIEYIESRRNVLLVFLENGEEYRVYAKPDVVIVCSYYQEGARILKKMREMGMNQPVLGDNGFVSPELGKMAGAAADNVYVSSMWSAARDTAVTKTFVENYTKKYGHAPDQFAAAAYDGVYMAMDAVERAGSVTDTRKIRDAMAEMKGFNGVCGTFSFDAKRDPVVDLILLKMKDGVFSAVREE